MKGMNRAEEDQSLFQTVEERESNVKKDLTQRMNEMKSVNRDEGTSRDGARTL